MSEPSPAPIKTWLTAPMTQDVSEAIDRLRRARDVQQIAVMPDVHLATDVCIGVVVATSWLLYPQAVGGDIGCGMLAVGFDVEATALHDPGMAGRVLAGLGGAVPARRRHRRAAIAPPPDLELLTLSHPSLEAMRRTEGAIEFATLGSGNHVIELQGDDDGRLWLMVHSGSRGMGPAIRDHHMGHGDDVGGGLRALDAASDQGVGYLNDARWARHYYRLTNRLRDAAPAAYKDIRAVLRAQKELVKVTRTLRPVLNYKGPERQLTFLECDAVRGVDVIARLRAARRSDGRGRR